MAELPSSAPLENEHLQEGFKRSHWQETAAVTTKGYGFLGNRLQKPVTIECCSSRITSPPTFKEASKKTPRIQRSSSKRKYFSPAETQDFWIQWICQAYPDLHRNLFLPPPVSDTGMSNDQHSSSHYKESKKTTSASSQHRIPRPTYVEYNDLRADKVLQWVLICLKKLSSKPKKKVMFGLSQLRFGRHLGEPCYAAATNFLPSSTSFPPLLQRNWKEGDFDLLIIHPCYGFVVFEVKAFGDNLTKHHMTQQDQKKIRRKLNEAILQLERATVVLSHLVSDIAPGLLITKTIVLPYLTATQVQQALTRDRQLIEEMCRCLGAKDLDEVTGLCLCSDQLSDPKTPWKVSKDILRELNLWWKRRVTNCVPDKQLTFDKYLRLVARLCGPAITVTVPCISPPPLHLQTSSQPSSLTGKCYYVQIALFPEQIYLLNSASPRVFLAGPPGTGKTLVLQLKAEEWLRCGSQVFVVSTWSGSRAASYMTYRVLQETRDIQQKSSESSGQLHLLQYDFNINIDIDNAVDDLTLAAKEGSLHVIADEIGPPSFRADCLKAFCDKLLTQVPQLHLWAASYYHELASPNWQVTYLTRPIRNPQSVVREMSLDWEITRNRVKQYSLSFDGLDGTYDPPIQWIYHRYEGHTTLRIEDCTKCGQKAAIFLSGLRAPENTRIASSAVTSTRGETASLQYRDMLILSSHDVAEDAGMVIALRNASIPVQVLKDEDTEDVATARSDVVWVANEDIVRGVERKIIIVIENTQVQLHALSRCTEQLMVITNRNRPVFDDVVLQSSSELRMQNFASQMTRTWEIAPKKEAAHMDVLPRKWGMQNTRNVAMAGKASPAYSHGYFSMGEMVRGGHIGRWFDEHSFDSAEKQLNYEKKDTKNIQQKNREENDALDKFVKKEEDDVKSQSIFVDADCSCYSVPYKFTADLSVTPSSQHILDSLENNDNNARLRNENAAEKFENLAQSPIFRDHWQDSVLFTTEGGKLQRQGSDVVLQVPAGATEGNANAQVYSALCTEDDYIKHKLHLPPTETIVSPLAEFWAGPDFRFQKHVQLTLPTCLPSEYDINLLHVYCISQNPEGQVDFSKLKRLNQLSETPGNKSTEAYFVVSEGGRVEVMTSHFSGYVCTYCGLCLNIGLEVYESHKRENGSLNVSIVTHFWDKLHLKDFRETKPELSSYTKVLSSTFQLRKVLTPAELQVDLIIDDEQTNLWQFKETRVPTTSFCLNWSKIKCENSTDHQAVKYTCLGPFCPGWKLKSTQNENEMMPSTLDAYLLVSHLKEGSSVPLWTSAQYHINVQEPYDGKKCVQTNVTINQFIRKVGNIHIAEQSEIQRSDQANGAMNLISTENEDSEDNEDLQLKTT